LSDDKQSSICDSDWSTVQYSTIKCNRWIDMIDRMYVLKGKFTTTEAWYIWDDVYNEYIYGEV
jgi:hypothetical protein